MKRVTNGCKTLTFQTAGDALHGDGPARPSTRPAAAPTHHHSGRGHAATRVHLYPKLLKMLQVAHNPQSVQGKNQCFFLCLLTLTGNASLRAMAAKHISMQIRKFWYPAATVPVGSFWPDCLSNSGPIISAFSRIARRTPDYRNVQGSGEHDHDHHKIHQ